MKKILRLFKDTTVAFWEDDVLQLSAALSYYVLFALPPIIMILLSVFAIFIPDKGAYTTLIDNISDIAGPSFAQALHPYSSQIESLINQSASLRYVGIILLVLALYAVINQLKYVLNKIWALTPRPGQPLFFHFRQRLASFVMIIILGVIVVTSFVIHVGVNVSAYYLADFITIPFQTIQITNAVLAFISTCVLISALYRLLPDGNMSWKDVFIGGLVTSLLFVLGKYAIGSMLGNSILISIYGITGSILVLLLWIYYSCIIFFFGAEFTQVYANSHGSGISYDPRYTLSFRNHSNQKKVVN